MRFFLLGMVNLFLWYTSRTLNKIIQSILWNCSKLADTDDFRTKFCKIYGIFRAKYGTFMKKCPEFSILSWKFHKFYKILFCYRLYPRLLNSSIKFIELFFSVNFRSDHTAYFDQCRTSLTMRPLALATQRTDLLLKGGCTI